MRRLMDLNGFHAKPLVRAMLPIVDQKALNKAAANSADAPYFNPNSTRLSCFATNDRIEFGHLQVNDLFGYIRNCPQRFQWNEAIS